MIIYDPNDKRIIKKYAAKDSKSETQKNDCTIDNGIVDRVPNNCVMICEGFFFKKLKIKKEGFRLSSPFAKKTIIPQFDLSIDYKGEKYRCEDRSEICIDIAVVYSITDPLKFYSQKNAENILHESMREWVNNSISTYKLEDISPNKIDIYRDSIDKINEFESTYGIKVSKITLQNLQYSAEYQKEIEEKASVNAEIERSKGQDQMLANTIQTLRGMFPNLSDEQFIKMLPTILASTNSSEFSGVMNSMMAINAANQNFAESNNTVNNEQKKGRKK